MITFEILPRYTEKLYNITKDYDIFNFEYELNEPYKTEFENLFIQNYYNREIAVETIELFLHYLKNDVQMKCKYYNKLLVENGKTLSIFKEYETNSNTVNIYKDSPLNLNVQETLNNQYATNLSENKIENSGRTQQEIDILDNYNKKLKDIMYDFINSFNDLFMKIY